MLLHDAEVKPLPGSYYTLGRSWTQLIITPIPGFEMFREVDPEKAAKYFAKEFERNPAYADSGINDIRMLMWQMCCADNLEELKARGRELAPKLQKRFSGNADALSPVVHAFQTFGNHEASGTIAEYIDLHYPDRSFLVSRRAAEIVQARGETERSVKLSEIFLPGIPAPKRSRKL